MFQNLTFSHICSSNLWSAHDSWGCEMWASWGDRVPQRTAYKRIRAFSGRKHWKRSMCNVLSHSVGRQIFWKCELNRVRSQLHLSYPNRDMPPGWRSYDNLIHVDFFKLIMGIKTYTWINNLTVPWFCHLWGQRGLWRKRYRTERLGVVDLVKHNTDR